MSRYIDAGLFDPQEVEREEEDRAFFDPVTNFATGAVKGLAGAVEGTLELATLFQADLPTNLGLGESEGFAQGLGSFASGIAAAFVTGGAAAGAAAKGASRVTRYARASRMFKGAQPEAAATVASAIAGRTGALGKAMKAEATFALGEFITVTGERGFDMVSLLGLDDTDLGEHFAITEGTSEFEARVISALNGLGVAGAAFGIGRSVSRGIKLTPKAEGEGVRALQSVAEEQGVSLELRSTMSREEMVAVARAAGVQFDSTGSFDKLTRLDLEDTAGRLGEVRAKRESLDEQISALQDSGGEIDAELLAERRSLLFEENDIAAGLSPEYERLAAGDRKGYVRAIGAPIAESLHAVRKKLEDKLGEKRFEGAAARFEQVDNLTNGMINGADLRLDDRLDYLQVLTPTESARMVQAIAMGGAPDARKALANRVDLPGELNGMVDSFAEKQVKSLIGEGATRADIIHAQTTYRQHVANLLSDVEPPKGKSLSKGADARRKLLALERIESFNALYRAMQGEYFLDDAVSSRRVFGRRLAGFSDDQARDAWTQASAVERRKVKNLERYTEELRKSRPDVESGKVLTAILELNDGTLGQKYRELKIASIMASPTLQSANIASAALRNIEEATSERIGGRLLRATRGEKVREVAASVDAAIANGKRLNGLQLATIQRVNFALVNMQQWFRSGKASAVAQGRTTVGSRISPSLIGSEEVSLNPSAFGIDPRKEAKVNFGARLASAADDATKASVIAQTTTNNIFNVLLHADPKQIEDVTKRAGAFQALFQDNINAAIRRGDTIEQGRLLEILEETAEVTGTSKALRERLGQRIATEEEGKIAEFVEASFLDMSERSLLASQHRTFTTLRSTGFEKDAVESASSIKNTQGAFWGRSVQGVRAVAELLPDGGRAFVLPFLNTPINVFLYGLDFTPMSKSFWDGIYTTLGGADSVASQFPGLRNATDLLESGDLNAARKVGRAVTGLTMGFGMLGAHVSGAVQISGGGPRDPQKRKAWLNAGNQPYAVEVGGQSISFDRMGTMALPFRLAADVIDVMDNPYGLEQTDEVLMGFIAAYGESMLSGLLMEQAANVYEAVTSGNTTRMAQILGQEATFLGAPATGNLARLAAPGVSGGIGAGIVGLGTTNTLAQSALRVGDTSVTPKRDLSFTEALKASFFDRYKAFGNDKARNILGQPITRRSSSQEALGAVVGIARFTTPGNDTLDVELAALNYPIAPPSTTMQGLNLLDPAFEAGSRSAYDRYSELIGQVEIGGMTFEQALVDTIRSPRYRRMPREGITEAGLKSPRHEAVAEIVAKYRARAAREVARERPRLARALRERKIAQTALTYGQSPETITSRFFPDLE